MAGFSVHIEGLQALDARLKEMGNAEAKKCIKKALKAGAVVVQKEIQERTPVRPDLPSTTALPVGALVNDIEVAGIVDGDNLAIMIGPGKHTEHAARLVEYGHRSVTGGTSTKGKDGKYRGNGREVKAVNGVTGGQVPPHPFIRPAYEASRTGATDVLVKTLASEIEKSSSGKK
jgi:HK97 gp10 family phage protein